MIDNTIDTFFTRTLRQSIEYHSTGLSGSKFCSLANSSKNVLQASVFFQYLCVCLYTNDDLNSGKVDSRMSFTEPLKFFNKPLP